MAKRVLAAIFGAAIIFFAFQLEAGTVLFAAAAAMVIPGVLRRRGRTMSRPAIWLVAMSFSALWSLSTAWEIAQEFPDGAMDQAYSAFDSLQKAQPPAPPPSLPFPVPGYPPPTDSTAGQVSSTQFGIMIGIAVYALFVLAAVFTGSFGWAAATLFTVAATGRWREATAYSPGER
jgi:hypothetical protein